MKTTERFKGVIKKYLDNLAQTNEQFAIMYSKPNKNIDDCITYILNTVQKSGCNGFAPNEIYGMALHYYDEDVIEVGKPIDCRVVINEPVVLTEEEKAEAKEKAIRELIEQEKRKLTAKKTPHEANKETRKETAPAEGSTTDISPNQMTMF